MESLLLEQLFKIIKEQKHLFFRSVKWSKRDVSKIKKKLNTILIDPKLYKSILINENKVQKIVLAKEIDSFAEKILTCSYFEFYGLRIRENVENEISTLRQQTSRNQKILISVSAANKKILRIMSDLGYRPWSYNLIGNVNQSLKLLQWTNLPPQFDVKPLTKHHLNELVRGEISAHTNDRTSCVGKWNKKKKQETIDYYKTWLKAKDVIGIVHNDKIVGAIAIMGSRPVGHIGSIWVLPEYQGQGLAKILYKEALLKMKEKKMTEYTGHTSTAKVLHLAKQMKRRVFVHNFKI